MNPLANKTVALIGLVAGLVILFAVCTTKPKEAEQFLAEGVDTRCEVRYRPYRGARRGMFLAEGDKIAVIAPSALSGREQADAVVNGLRKWGYVPVEGKHVCAETRTLDDVMEDLAWALQDPGTKAVFCVRGGYGASEVADRLPLASIKAANKLVIGYSDISVYHSAWTVAGVPSIHACMSGAFGDFPEKCLEAEQKILRGEVPVYTCDHDGRCQQGNAKGILVGGNLATFTAVIGAAYDCTKTGKPYILFFEDVGEDVRHLHRYLTILKHAGVLDQAAGIVFGEWTELPKSENDYLGTSRGGAYQSVADMISRQFLPGISVPVAFGFPAGHGNVNYPLLMGEMAELRVGPKSFTLIPGADSGAD